jgi:hypothetical protein
MNRNGSNVVGLIFVGHVAKLRDIGMQIETDVT